MPYWSIFCIHCSGYIADALLECLPLAKQAYHSFGLLFGMHSGAALACPYCNNLIGFDDAGQPALPQTGWPVFRYGRTELEAKRAADGEPATTSLTDWAMQHRFTQAGTHQPLAEYTYAEQAPANETVP